MSLPSWRSTERPKLRCRQASEADVQLDLQGWALELTIICLRRWPELLFLHLS